MNKFVFSVFLFAAVACTSAFGQSNAPLVPDNATPRDNNIKMRSVELDRVEREAKKTPTGTQPVVNSKIESKFPEIKEDFEGIQVSEAAIIKTYTMDKEIDFTLIAASAEQIGKHAKRLENNLFATRNETPKSDEKAEKEPEKPVAIRELIISLDDAIGSLVGSKLFANLKVIEPDVAAKAHADLLRIQVLSEKLSVEAKKPR